MESQNIMDEQWEWAHYIYNILTNHSKDTDRRDLIANMSFVVFSSTLSDIVQDARNYEYE